MCVHDAACVCTSYKIFYLPKQNYLHVSIVISFIFFFTLVLSFYLFLFVFYLPFFFYYYNYFLFFLIYRIAPSFVIGRVQSTFLTFPFFLFFFFPFSFFLLHMYVYMREIKRFWLLIIQIVYLVSVYNWMTQAHRVKVMNV